MRSNNRLLVLLLPRSDCLLNHTAPWLGTPVWSESAGQVWKWKGSRTRTCPHPVYDGTVLSVDTGWWGQPDPLVLGPLGWRRRKRQCFLEKEIQNLGSYFRIRFLKFAFCNLSETEMLTTDWLSKKAVKSDDYFMQLIDCRMYMLRKLVFGKNGLNWYWFFFT